MSSLSESSFSKRRKDLKRPDEFQRSVGGGFKQLENYQKPLGIFVVFAILVSFATVWYKSHKGAKEAAARDTLFNALQVLRTEMQDLAKTYPPVPKQSEDSSDPLNSLKDPKKKDTKKMELVPPTSDDIAFATFDINAKLPKSLAELSKVTDLHKGSIAAHEAQVVIGKLFFDHGNPKVAMDWFTKSAQSAPTPFFEASASLLLGAAQEANGDCKTAVGTYDRAVGTKEISVLGEALMAKARCLETLNQTEDAKKVYDKIITDLPDTAYSRNAEVFRAQL